MNKNASILFALRVLGQILWLEGYGLVNLPLPNGPHQIYGFNKGLKCCFCFSTVFEWCFFWYWIHPKSWPPWDLWDFLQMTISSIQNTPQKNKSSTPPKLHNMFLMLLQQSEGQDKQHQQKKMTTHVNDDILVDMGSSMFFSISTPISSIYFQANHSLGQSNPWSQALPTPWWLLLNETSTSTSTTMVRVLKQKISAEKSW